MSEEKINRSGSMGDTMYGGPPIFPDDPSEYPVLVNCDDERAIVAVSRHKGYLLYRDGLAKSEVMDLEVLRERYRGIITPADRDRWAMEAIGKPVDW